MTIIQNNDLEVSVDRLVRLRAQFFENVASSLRWDLIRTFLLDVIKSCLHLRPTKVAT